MDVFGGMVMGSGPMLTIKEAVVKFQCAQLMSKLAVKSQTV